MATTSPAPTGAARTLVARAGTSSLELSVVADGVREQTTRIEGWRPGDTGPVRDLLDRVPGIAAVGHRVVHGGATFTGPARVDDDVLGRLAETRSLAPLDNPPALDLVRSTAEELTQVPSVVCFDTSFHRDLPPAAATYPLPREPNERYGLRRYGAHGLSHAHAARRALELVEVPPGRSPKTRVVTAHLGPAPPWPPCAAAARSTPPRVSPRSRA